MKIIILCLLCGFLCLGCADMEEGSFTITGQMKGLSDGMVRLYTYPPSNLLLDSCRIKDGKYYLKGKIEEAQLCLLYFESRTGQQESFMPMVRFFISPGDLKMYSELQDVKGTFRVENCPLNDDLEACEKYLKGLPEYKHAMELTDDIQLAFHRSDMGTVRTLSGLRDSLFLSLIDRLFLWKEDAPHNQAVAYLCSQYAAPLSGEQLRKITDRFDPAFRTSYYVSQMIASASRETQLQPGKPFPDFKVCDPEGNSYTLADFQGKYLFVEFSASWCGWCKKEIPFIRRAYEKLGDKNIAFITMMMDTDRAQWLKDIEKEKITWFCFSDLQGMKKSPMASAYNLSGLPDSFVVDPQGKIVKRNLRGNEVLDFLSSLVEKNEKTDR